MKNPIPSLAPWKFSEDALLRKVLRRCGVYFHPGDRFYQELWRQRLVSLGFGVLLVQKLTLHDVWEVRLCGSLAAQTYLLVSKPVPKKHVWATDLMVRQLKSEIHEIAKDLGLPIRRDSITVSRTGSSYFTVAFIWPKGKPAMLLKREKRTDAFSFFIQPWLRRNRN
ncbi:MAG TPA: hypothetical protein VGJ30_02225 [Candidatus Angelobacter sp.]